MSLRRAIRVGPPVLLAMLLASRGALQATDVKSPEDNTLALFDKLDVNHDGRLTAAEIPSEKKRLFERLLRLAGKDADGQLTRAEFAAQLKNVESPDDKPADTTKPNTPDKPKTETPKITDAKPAVDPEKMFDRLDSKHAGKLSADDVPEERRQFFKRLLVAAGKSPGGNLDREEFIKAMKATLAKRAGVESTASSGASKPPTGDFDVDQVVKRIMTLSKRSDGKLTINELPERLKNRFDKIDANHDGLVDESELRAWLTIAKQRLQAANNK